MHKGLNRYETKDQQEDISLFNFTEKMGIGMLIPGNLFSQLKTYKVKLNAWEAKRTVFTHYTFLHI